MMADRSAGEIRLFAGEFAPQGWLDCDGSERDIAQYPDLYNAIGKHFGASAAKFRLPNLREQVPIHLGMNGFQPVGHTGKRRVTLPAHALQLRYIIATTGAPDDHDPLIGEVRAFGTDFVPRGWLPCSGGLVPLAGYKELFTILGKRFGGNGSSNFQLPDLRFSQDGDEMDAMCVLEMTLCIAAVGRVPPRP